MSPEVRHEELEVNSSTDKDFESDDSRTSQDEVRDKKHNDNSTTTTSKPQLMLRANTFSFNLISLEPRPDGILDVKKRMVAAEENAGKGGDAKKVK